MKQRPGSDEGQPDPVKEDDIILGLGGGLVGGWIFRALGVSPEAGMVTMAVVAFVGAAIPIVAQRKIWPTIA